MQVCKLDYAYGGSWFLAFLSLLHFLVQLVDVVIVLEIGWLVFKHLQSVIFYRESLVFSAAEGENLGAEEVSFHGQSNHLICHHRDELPCDLLAVILCE